MTDSTSTRPTIALVTSASGRPRDDDLAPLTAALDRLGAEVTVVDWDDPAADWSAFDLAVVRSTWDYTDRYAGVPRVERSLRAAHPPRQRPRVIRWNTDKRYLADLAGAGVRVVPTTFVESEADLAACGWLEARRPSTSW